ncbi:MAG TPA: serine hydrolase domain-containing protein [Terriglobales bacterium]|jgi:CubicO group peptidase (beta-lactamase class C family)
MVVLLVLGQHGGAAGKADSQTVDAIFAGLKSSRAPGAAVLVIKDGRPLFQRGYGVADLHAFRPIDEHTNFRLASVTKQFTAMAVMLLVHDGKLRYENRLTDVFPDFAAYGGAITIRHLLNHTSGLQDYEDLMPKYEGVPQEKIPQIQDAGVLRLLQRTKTTKFAPGTKWEYSNSGYVLLGLVVAKVSGEPFGQFLHDRIFDRLKMTGTVAFEKGKNEVGNRAFGHTRIGDRWQQTDQSPTSATLGDGGVYSSLTDLEKWDRALRENTLLPQKEMEAAITPAEAPGVEEPDGTPAAYGFGWFLNPYEGHKRMWHYGETMGFRTAVQRFVDDGLTVIVLCNRSDLNPTKMAKQVANSYLAPH